MTYGSWGLELAESGGSLLWRLSPFILRTLGPRPFFLHHVLQAWEPERNFQCEVACLGASRMRGFARGHARIVNTTQIGKLDAITGHHVLRTRTMQRW